MTASTEGSGSPGAGFSVTKISVTVTGVSRVSTYINNELYVSSLGRASMSIVYVVAVAPVTVTIPASNAGSTSGYAAFSKRKRTSASAPPSGIAAVNVILPPLTKLNGYRPALSLAKPAHD